MQEASNFPPGIARFIEMSSSFVPTPARRSFETRIPSQHVYDLGVSNLFGNNTNIDSDGVKEKRTEEEHDTNSSLISRKIAFVFGGYATIDDSLQTLHHLLKAHDLESIKSFIARSEQLLNTLVKQAQSECDTPWLNFKINLRQWISNPAIRPKHNQYLNSSTIAFPFVLIHQYCELLTFLHASDLSLAQLNQQCTFSAGFSLGLITSYIVSICSTHDELVEYALNSIEVGFWLGFRLVQRFQQLEIKRYKQFVIGMETIPFSPNRIVTFGSIQISGVNYTEIQLFLTQFNEQFQISNNYPFEICVVLQSNRVTVGGLRCYMIHVISSLTEKFPNAQFVEIPIDLPVHARNYFEGISTLVMNDLKRNQIHFEDSIFLHNYYCISSIDGLPMVSLSNTIEFILIAITERVCRWDMVSLSLLEQSKNRDDIEPLLLIDIGPGGRSRDLMNNLKQLAAAEPMFYNNTDRFMLFPLAESFATRTATASYLRQQQFFTEDNGRFSLDNSIAIVGMACRFPQAMSIEEYFYNLMNRRNCVSVIPKERWNHHQFVSDNDSEGPYKMKARHLGIMEDIDMFDHRFFNLNVRDASHMDPQQRLTMECCYLALENAGYVMNEGSRLGMSEFRIGVFVGTSGSDNYRKHMQAHLDAYLPQCGSRSFQAGRVSYFLKFCGPSVQVDTACSASMTCLHLACQAIDSKECDAAVVSGVLITIDPVEYAGLAAGGFFSPTGICKAFSAEADGYIRSDGVAAIVIRPYQQAVENHDFIHSVIRATNANQSGQASHILLPSKSQISSLMQQCLDKAHLQPSDIQYVEAHATGTQGGDPVETNAIIETLGKKAQRGPFHNNPLYLGSHKAFIGHTEAAAGLAGIIKVSMMLQHKLMTPHFDLEPDKINPEILINNPNTNVIIPMSQRPWTVPKAGTPRCAIVNAFGFSGANACCILQEAPSVVYSDPQMTRKFCPIVILTLSAKHPDSLRALIMKMIQYLTAVLKHQKSSTDSTAELRFLHSLSYTMTARRTHFTHRIAIVAHDLSSLIQRLFSVIKDEERIIESLTNAFLPDTMPTFFFESNEKHVYSSPGIAQPTIDTKRSEIHLLKKIVFMFGGQGSQYYKMCQELIAFQPSFDLSVRLCSKIFEQIHPNYFPNNLTIYSFLTHSDPASLLDHKQFQSTLFVQPLLFSIEYSLGNLLLEWNIQPDYMIGHSFGEIVAACLGNVLKLHDALFLIGHRAKLMHSCPGGSMLACNMTLSRLQAMLGSLEIKEEEISIASQNSQDSIVIAGSHDNIQLIEDYLHNNKVCRKFRLPVSHAFHSHLMFSIQNEFQSIANTIAYQSSSIPILSNLDGAIRTEFNSEYWAKQMVSTVKFHQGIELLKQLSRNEKFELIFMELSPTPVLSSYTRESQLTSIFTLNKNSLDMQTIYDAVAQLYCCYGDSSPSSSSLNINWDNFHRVSLESNICGMLSLPSYVFNSKSLWLKLPWVCDNVMMRSTRCSPPSAHIVLPQIGYCDYQKNLATQHFQLKFPIFDRQWKIDIQNHIVNNICLFSIPLYISLITQFYTYVYQQDRIESSYVTVKDVTFTKGFIWEETDNDSDSTRTMLLELFPPTNVNDANQKDKLLMTFKISSVRTTNENQPVCHANGSICFEPSVTPIDPADNQSSFLRIKQNLDDTTNRDNHVTYEADDFYKVSSQVNTYYGSHFQSMKLFVCEKSGLTSWTQQIINTNQPYPCEPQCKIYPPYLDSFLQSYGVQAHYIKDVQTPFVAVFIKECTIQLDVFNQEMLKNKPSFFAETTVKVNSSQRITCSTMGFDDQRKCVMKLNGLLMLSSSTDHSVTRKNHFNSALTTNELSRVKSTGSSIKDCILSIMCQSLECESREIDCDEDFLSLGIDSLLAIEIRRKLQNALSISLPYSLFFDYSNVNSLTDYLISLTSPKAQPTLDNFSNSSVNYSHSEEEEINGEDLLHSYHTEHASPNAYNNDSSNKDEHLLESSNITANGCVTSLLTKVSVNAQHGDYSEANKDRAIQANHDCCHTPFERSAHLISLSSIADAALTSDEPIIFMHTSSGRIASYMELVRILEQLKRPLCGIEAFGFEDDESAEHSMPVILNSYANSLKKIYPHGGRVTIVGYSAAGILAYLFAIKLLKSNAPKFDVKSIVLIDAGAPSDKRIRSVHMEFIDYVVEQVVKSNPPLKRGRKLASTGDLIQRYRSVVTAHLLSIRDYFYSDIPPAYKINSLLDGTVLSEEEPQTYFIAHGAELGHEKYASSVIDKITLIRANDTEYFSDNFDNYERSLGWNSYLQSVLNVCGKNVSSSVSIPIFTMDATHFNILDSPQVEYLASLLIDNHIV